MLARSALAGVLLVAVAGGCGATLTYRPYRVPPRPMAPIPIRDVLMLATYPSRPYVEVAHIGMQQDSNWSEAEYPELLRAIRKRAAKEGCEAVVWARADDKAEDVLGVLASCIVFDPPLRERRGLVLPPDVRKVSDLPEAK